MARKKDENQTAFSSLQELLRRDAERDGIITQPRPPEEKDITAGNLGGPKSGKARAGTLSVRKQKTIAKKVAKGRRNTSKGE